MLGIFPEDHMIKKTRDRRISYVVDRDAAKYITKDLVDDEAAYAKPLDAQRGAKYLGLIVAPRVKEDTRKRIAHIYADVGVNLNA